MNTITLIMVLFTGTATSDGQPAELNQPVVQTVEFDDLDACEHAAQRYRSRNGTAKGNVFMHVDVECVWTRSPVTE